MRLSDRLERIAATAAAVTEGYVADVGTDHGFVPIRLVESGNLKQVIAMDVRKGPLARASEHVQAYHMEGQIKVRLSDGLKELTPGEADTVIIAGMGGNAGTQSLTIVVRGIALGELTGDNARRVFFKEFGVGILSGVSIGLVVALICGVMQQNPIFGLVVGLAMLLNMAFATIAGYAVPVILKKINVDPALASSVFVTTVTDVLGFFFFLGLATLFLPYLI